MAIVVKALRCVVTVLSIILLHAGGGALAKAPDAVINVPATVEVDAGSDVVLPIKLSPADAVPEQAMVLVRGVPATSSLSEGRLFPSGVWAVKPSLAPKLQLSTRAGANDDTHLIVSLVTLDGTYLSNATVHLQIKPRRQPAVASGAGKADEESQSAEGDSVAALAVETDMSTQSHINARAQADDIDQPGVGEKRVLLSDEIKKILKIMMKGDQYLVEGKIAAARRFYEHAAEMGWPDGAAAIGRTYDPEHLGRFPILGGIEPDAAIASGWYAKARDLGARIKVGDLQAKDQR